MEVSVFSAVDEPWEIYFSFGIFYGIVYGEETEIYTIRDKMKEDLQKEYDQSQEPSDEFISRFIKKYDVCMPSDTVCNMDLSSWF